MKETRRAQQTDQTGNGNLRFIVAIDNLNDIMLQSKPNKQPVSLSNYINTSGLVPRTLEQLQAKLINDMAILYIINGNSSYHDWSQRLKAIVLDIFKGVSERTLEKKIMRAVNDLRNNPDINALKSDIRHKRANP